MSHPVPDTSHAAYRKAKDTGRIETDRQKIKEALKVLGVCNYEKIADHLGIDRHAVGRRLSELERKEEVYKPGTKSKTKSGCMANDYCLTTGIRTDNETRNLYQKGEKSAAEHSVELIKECKQIKLFL